jgi:DNA-binding response OmpR family regulator
MAARNAAMSRLLIIEDHAKLLRTLQRGLQEEGYAVSTASNGTDGYELARGSGVDAVLLDLMLPGRDGLTVLRNLRRDGFGKPILIMTARDAVPDRVSGLDAGADDYLVKPFSATELLARVRAVLRRAQPPSETGQARFFTHDNLKIDFARAEVWRGEQPVSLSATEYRLLLQFAHNIGKILTSEDLLTSVWGSEYKNDKEILWVSIARLRQKLEEDAHNPHHIVTRSGLGYLMPPIEA